MRTFIMALLANNLLHLRKKVHFTLSPVFDILYINTSLFIKVLHTKAVAILKCDAWLNINISINY